MSIGSPIRRPQRLRALAASAAAILVLATGAASSQGSSPSSQTAPHRHGSRQPVALKGTPLGPTTGLRLLVADVKPFVLDVDTGVETPVSGIDLPHGGVVSVVGTPGRAAFLIADPMLAGTGQRYARNWSVYAVPGGSTAASPIGAGRYDAVPQTSGPGIWVRQYVSRSHCRLQRIGLDGQVSFQNAIPCNWTFTPGGSLGLVANRSRIVDPRTGRTVTLTVDGVLAAAGRRLLTARPYRTTILGTRLHLLDAATGAQRPVRWPSIVNQLDEPAVDPTGRWIAIGFGDPSWKFGPEQVLDVWVLDSRTGALTHVPGMPAFVHLKFTSMDWTADGRLVLLGEDDERGFVAVWRPGQPQLAIRNVQLPQRTGGSDAFAIVR